MIDFDTSRLPTGSLGWSQLFEAIESALPEDESFWIEFKAGHDAASTEGKAAIAKAIVAFANRDPGVAQRWLEGHALIVLGVQPGEVPGAEIHDPATIHQTVQPFLAAPAPKWDLGYHSYKGKQVLVIIVDPPRAGDPIAVIGKSSGRVEDGHVYVRRPGVSERAKSSDIRQLTTRLVQSHAPSLNIEVTATPADGIEGLPIHEWPDSWIDAWVEDERRRLLKPLEDFERPKGSPTGADILGRKGLTAFDGFAKLNVGGAFGVTTAPEARTPQQYRDEIEAHLDECRKGLTGAEFEVALAVLPPVVWHVNNLTEHNLTDVKVKILVEGDVEAFESEDMPSLRSRIGAAPRLWGPTSSSKHSADLVMGAVGVQWLRVKPGHRAEGLRRGSSRLGWGERLDDELAVPRRDDLPAEHRCLIDGRIDLTVDPDPSVGPGILDQFLEGEHLDRLSGLDLVGTAKCSLASQLGGLHRGPHGLVASIRSGLGPVQPGLSHAAGSSQRLLAWTPEFTPNESFQSGPGRLLSRLGINLTR